MAPPQYERFRSILAAPWRVVRRERNVRRFLIANTAWEATFAGIRTFVVLYIIDGLGQPLYISSTVLGVVAAGYVVAALAAGRLGDEFGIGNVILGASVVYGFGLLVAGFAQTWHWWYYGLIAPVAVAGGTVMTLAWGAPLQGHAADRPRHDHRPRHDDQRDRARDRAPRRRGRDRHLPRLLPLHGRLRRHLARGRRPGPGRHPARRAPRRVRGRA